MNISCGTLCLTVTSDQILVGRARIPVTWELLKENERKAAYCWEQLAFGWVGPSLLLQIFHILLVFYFNEATATWETNPGLRCVPQINILLHWINWQWERVELAWFDWGYEYIIWIQEQKCHDWFLHELWYWNFMPTFIFTSISAISPDTELIIISEEIESFLLRQNWIWKKVMP